MLPATKTPNDLKKGTFVILRDCGWRAKLEDSKKGNIRVATVYGNFTEVGSIYAHDIIAFENENGQLEGVKHTPQMLACMTMNNALFR